MGMKCPRQRQHMLACTPVEKPFCTQAARCASSSEILVTKTCLSLSDCITHIHMLRPPCLGDSSASLPHQYQDKLVRSMRGVTACSTG